MWVNDIQSLFGYTLAATLFVTSGLSPWTVLAGIVLAGLIVMVLVNLSGEPGVRYGIPYPVLARASMGIRGANVPAMIRGTVAIFWYGVQSYFAATAVTLVLLPLFGGHAGPTFLGMDGVTWLSYGIVCLFQLGLFLRGIDRVATFLDWAGPLVFTVMAVLVAIVWVRAGPDLIARIGQLAPGGEAAARGGPMRAFVGVVGTMIAYFAAVVINYGDFSRFVRSRREMRLGNLLGLPLGLAVFSALALLLTAGTSVIFGETLTNPVDVVARIDHPVLTLVAALTFFIATVGINLVANFIPPAYDLSNLVPWKLDARRGGLVAAAVAFLIGALWVSVIEAVGIARFVDALGAVLAPLYGIMIADYYRVRGGRLQVGALFSADPAGPYYYSGGWNRRGLVAFGVAATFSVATVWAPGLSGLSGYGWLLGALLGGALHVGLARAVPGPPT